MADRPKKSLGRDPFQDGEGDRSSRSLERLINGPVAHRPGTREVVMSVRLTPANIKHLDAIRGRLAERGRSEVTRDDLIRIAITLLSVDDIT